MVPLLSFHSPRFPLTLQTVGQYSMDAALYVPHSGPQHLEEVAGEWRCLSEDPVDSRQYSLMLSISPVCVLDHQSFDI